MNGSPIRGQSGNEGFAARPGLSSCVWRHFFSLLRKEVEKEKQDKGGHAVVSPFVIPPSQARERCRRASERNSTAWCSRCRYSSGPRLRARRWAMETPGFPRPPQRGIQRGLGRGDPHGFRKGPAGPFRRFKGFAKRRGVKKICRWHIFSLRPQRLCREDGPYYVLFSGRPEKYGPGRESKPGLLPQA